MNPIKEVLVFSEQGDPKKLKTWSNVPYFLVANLEEQGIKVISIDLEIEGVIITFIKKSWNYFFNYIIGPKILFYDFHRTKLYSYITNRKIKKSIKKHPNADCYIFTTFSFSAKKFSTKPSILFCDWTIEYHINYFLERNPNSIERLAINRQNAVINTAEFVVVLFPGIAKFLSQQFKNRDFIYNGNVVNNLETHEIVDLGLKWENQKILFIGSKKYLDGANKLLITFKKLQKNYPKVELNIIGIPSNLLSEIPANVNIYGYLDKDNIDDRRIYYALMKDSKVFVNTSPKWGAFSASLEAMYFYNPVLVTPYNEFTETFGKNIEFGSYVGFDDNLENILNDFLNLDFSKYCELAKNAEIAVRPHSWKSFTDSLIKKISI